jgi:hypothetical protein
MNFKSLAELKHCKAAFDAIIGNPDIEKILD